MNPSAPILIVDNSEDDVELFRIGLADIGLPNPVEVCRDGVLALDYLLRRGAYAGRPGPLPQVMLMDLKMPRMGGIEVLRQVRNQPSLRTLPVVIMTSSHHDRDIEAAYEAGANGFVIKPVGFEQLLESAAAIGRYWGRFNSTCEASSSGPARPLPSA